MFLMDESASKQGLAQKISRKEAGGFVYALFQAGQSGPRFLVFSTSFDFGLRFAIHLIFIFVQQRRKANLAKQAARTS